MNRIDSLKKQYPMFNLSVFDLFKIMDKTGKNKYIQLFCQLFKNYFETNCHYDLMSFNEDLFNKLKLDKTNFTETEIIFISYFIRILGDEHIVMLVDFIDHMENKRIENNDITTYKTFDDIKAGIVNGEFKEIQKKLKNQIVNEFENDEWIVMRPLTIESSIKYGSNTKWCTASKNDPHYFYNHIKDGILIYCINKKTGYKFAGYKDFNSNDINFWDPSDKMVDSMTLPFSENMFKILKELFSSKKSNMEFCDNEQIKNVNEHTLKCVNTVPGQNIDMSYILNDTLPTHTTATDSFFRRDTIYI